MAWGDKGDVVRVCGVGIDDVRDLCGQYLTVRDRLAQYVAALSAADLEKMPSTSRVLAHAARTLQSGLVAVRGDDLGAVANRRNLRIQLNATLAALAELLDG